MALNRASYEKAEADGAKDYIKKKMFDDMMIAECGVTERLLLLQIRTQSSLWARI